ncbi:MAG: MarR family transcriptional regulator [Pseudomonadota bacterium]
MGDKASPFSDDAHRLARSVHLLIRALLVAGRAGQPAEGKIPFNPLYFHFLGLLFENEAMRPSDMASVLGVSRTTLSTASKALQTRGLVEQSKDPTDGRAQILRLTQDGLEVVEAIRRQDLRNMTLLLAQLEPDQGRVIIDALEQVADKITSLPNDP